MYPTFGGNTFPYTNLHTLNLDWILAQVQSIPAQIRQEVGRLVIPSANVYPTYDAALAASLPVGSIFTISEFRAGDGFACSYRVTNGAGVIYGEHFAAPVVTDVYPENFGAWGDGLHDDTQACNLWINSGLVLWACGQYLITDSLSTANNVCIKGGGGVFIRALSNPVNLFQMDGEAVIINCISMRDQGGLVYHSGGWVRTGPACKLVSIDGVTVRALVHGQDGEGGWCLALAGDMVCVRNCSINTAAFGEWGDGIHILRGGVVYIDNCDITSGDDCIALLPQDLGSTPANYGSVGRAFITNCRLRSENYCCVKYGVYVADNSVVCGDVTIEGCDLAGKRNITFTDSRAGIEGATQTIQAIGCTLTSTEANRPIYLDCVADSMTRAIFDDCKIVDAITQEPLCALRSCSAISFRSCEINCRTIAYKATADSSDVLLLACDVSVGQKLFDGQINFRAVGNVIAGGGDNSNIFYKTSGELVFCNNVLTNDAKFYASVGTCAGNVGGANSYSKTVTLNNGTFTIA